jgi:hypothetical protein
LGPAWVKKVSKSVFKKKNKPDLVTHISNPSYVGGGGKRITNPGQPQAKV